MYFFKKNDIFFTLGIIIFLLSLLGCDDPYRSCAELEEHKDSYHQYFPYQPGDELDFMGHLGDQARIIIDTFYVAGFFIWSHGLFQKC